MKNANLSSEPLLCSFVLGQFKSGLLRLGYNHELCLVTKPPKFFDKWIKCIVLYSFRMITEYVWPMVSCGFQWSVYRWSFRVPRTACEGDWLNEFTGLLTLKYQLVLIAQLCDLEYWRIYKLWSVLWFLWIIVSCILLFLAHFQLAP